MKTKRKNPTDATMRNVRAANKRLKSLELVVIEIVKRVPGLLESGAFDLAHNNAGEITGVRRSKHL